MEADSPIQYATGCLSLGGRKLSFDATQFKFHPPYEFPAVQIQAHKIKEFKVSGYLMDKMERIKLKLTHQYSVPLEQLPFMHCHHCCCCRSWVGVGSAHAVVVCSLYGAHHLPLKKET